MRQERHVALLCLMSEDMRDSAFISIVILNYNGKGFLEPCLNSVLNSDYDNFEVVLVDNASTDGSVELIESIFGANRKIRIIRNKENTFFTGGNNIGIREAKGEYIIVLNNDTEVDPKWLREIALVMGDEEIGAAQPKIRIFNQNPAKIDYAGATIDKYGFAKGFGSGEIDNGQFDDVGDIFYAGGTAMILKRKVLDEVGIFDERFGMHWEDADLSWRIRLKGYRIVLIPKALVYHKGSLSMSKFTANAKVAWYVRKNRIAGLLKNYSAISLIKYLPVLILIYLLNFVREFFTVGTKVALSSFWAIVWNISELPYILAQRRIVQNKIRSISDQEIISHMQKGCVVF